MKSKSEGLEMGGERKKTKKVASMNSAKGHVLKT